MLVVDVVRVGVQGGGGFAVLAIVERAVARAAGANDRRFGSTADAQVLEE